MFQMKLGVLESRSPGVWGVAVVVRGMGARKLDLGELALVAVCNHI